MNRSPTRVQRKAFTLVEMMVVVAIIALLLAALLPAFGIVKKNAKIAQTNAQIKALDVGINAFRAEAALGGALPPSASDKDSGAGRQLIANPQADAATPEIRVSGAHLLVHAMIGADGLGTPGFRDVSSPPDGKWSNDTHKKFEAGAGKSGLYAVDPAGKEKFPRYGGSGYVDEKMKESAKSIQELADKGVVVNPDILDQNVAKNERVFLDPWDHPILYYKANASALRMTGASGKPPGIYWQEDNGIITGSDSSLRGDPGLDFGQGTEGTCNGGKCYHHIAGSAGPEPSLGQTANWLETFRADTTYDHSFARFIIDGSVKARPTPVQKDSYLLISAGPDSRYGTDDDVLNWTRKTD